MRKESHEAVLCTRSRQMRELCLIRVQIWSIHDREVR
jgi:hypothetical protein